MNAYVLRSREAGEVLIDIDARNADLARERIGMFLTVHEHGDAYRLAA